MIDDVHSSIPKHCIRMVSEGYNPSIRHIMWKEVLELEGNYLLVRPGVLQVAVKSMYRDDTMDS